MYPKIKINGKNDIAFRISSPSLSKEDAKILYEYVVENFDSLWQDNLYESEPEKGKWVRNAKGTKLGKLHKLVNRRILAEYDKDLPYFIHGGVSMKSNITAAYALLGYNRKRTVMSLDIKRFFESVSEQSVYDFFNNSSCSTRGASTLSKLCCVPLGQKDSGNTEKVLGRGFATSSRLAIWATIRSFYVIHTHVMKQLKDYDPRMVVYVDDIGISASRVPEHKLRSIADEVNNILQKYSSGRIKLNKTKTKVMPYHKGAIHYLGLKLNRSSVGFTSHMQSRFDQLKHRVKFDRKGVRNVLKGYRRYKGGIKKINRDGNRR